MRLMLLVMLMFCMAGFAATSGAVSVHAGRLMLDSAALAQTMPVLVALAAPMVTMAVILMVTVMLTRLAVGKGRRGPSF